MKSIKTDRLGSDIKPGDDSESDNNVDVAVSPDKSSGANEVSAKNGHNSTPTVPTSSEPARLCYVDDSRTSAYVVKRMLRPFGYSVDHYESAEPALIALVQGCYDLLLTDLKVSPKGMDGDDLVRALRNSGHTKISSLPVIVITGSTDTSILADVYEAGANQIMTKPVNGEELNEHIRKLVFSHHADLDSESKTKKSDTAIDSGNAQFESRSEEVVLESTEDGFANFMGPGTTSETPANVVFFDSEIKQNKSFDIDEALHDLDSIPVLNPVDMNTTVEDGDANSPDVDADNADQDDSERRVLANGPVTSNDHLTNQYVPKPTTRSAPAAKVKPTITVKPSIDERIENEKNAAAEARREAAKKAQAAVTAAQKNRRIQAEKAKKKAQAAAALKKLKEAAAAKAAAAKRVQLIKKQKAIAAAKAKAIAAAAAANVAAAKKKQQEEALKAENLKLEPKDGDTFVSPTAVPPTAPAEPAPSPSSAPAASSEHGMVSTKPIELIHPRDGGNISSGSGHTSSAFTQKPPPPPPPPRSPPPPQQPQQPFTASNTGSAPPPPPNANGYSDNILRGMDQFPLVEADMPDVYAPSRLFSSFGSLFELYGFKKVMMMALGILVVFFTYDSWSTWLNIDSGTPVDLSIVEQGEIFQAITVPGKVVSKLRVNVSPAIAGRLTKVLADEGDSVTEGQLLARLDDREAKSYLKKATASNNSAKEDVELARRTLSRLQQAFKKGAVPRQLVEDAEVDLRSAKARESISSEEVRTAKVSLENPRILAPFSGVITNRYVEVGQWVVPSESLFTLIDPKQREVEVKVDSADSNGIAVGQTVSLSSDAFPGLEWAESVSRLAAATTNVGNANTISVYISLGINSPSLRFGQQVDADIRTAWNPNAVKVPYGAIINKNGKSLVAVLEGDKARLVEVTTGIEDFSHVEITHGVSIGETIILANGKRLREGERVYLSTN